jgi:streptogramin lyase
MPPAGRFTLLNPLPTNYYTGAITAGPDGHIWFVEELNDGRGSYSFSLARVVSNATGGTFRTFALSKLQRFDVVISLITGADGNLWFGTAGAALPSYDEFGKIGRMTPNGDLLVFSQGTFTEPRSLAVGSDHTLWFACSPGVARVTPDSTQRIFTPPGDKVRYCGSAGLATDPTGGFWYLGAGPTVMHASSDGSTFTSYPLPPAPLASRPVPFWGLLPATDGTLWLISWFAIGHLV